MLCSMHNNFIYPLILVYAIREAATTNLKKLVEQFGQDWAAVSIP